MTAIPLFCAKTVNANFDFSSVLQRVVDSHWYILGKEVTQFEHDFALYIGTTHAIGLANGTDALELALKALSIGPDDTVACVANAGYYSSTAIHLVGATPVYIDVDRNDLGMCPLQLEQFLAKATTKPKAIIVTHLYGQAAQIEQLAAIASLHQIPLIEDCAQAHGAIVNGKRVGSFGELACFSFYPTKNLGALGDGGAICTSSPELNERVRQLRQYGWSQKYTVSLAGGKNSRLDELQAAILSIKLPVLDQHNAQRRAIAQQYNQAFADLALQLPCSTDMDYVAHLYVIRTPDRDQLRQHLLQAGISTDIHYPVLDTKQPAYATTPQALPISQQACDQVLSLPCYPGLPLEQVQQVISAVRAFFHN